MKTNQSKQQLGCIFSAFFFVATVVLSAVYFAAHANKLPTQNNQPAPRTYQTAQPNSDVR
jgi:hypothetical protein